MEKERKEILSQISLKNGLWGSGARLYIDDPKLSNLFIVECFEQCHIRNFQKYIGEALVLEIIAYVLNLEEQGQVVLNRNRPPFVKDQFEVRLHEKLSWD